MIDQLKADGLLDDNGSLTQKGHDYVKQTIRSLDERAYKFVEENPLDIEKPKPEPSRPPIMWRYK